MCVDEGLVRDDGHDGGDGDGATERKVGITTFCVDVKRGVLTVLSGVFYQVPNLPCAGEINPSVRKIHPSLC